MDIRVQPAFLEFTDQVAHHLNVSRSEAVRLALIIMGGWLRVPYQPPTSEDPNA